ncbi:MAG: hypothetical protein AB1715_03215 [Acidobacteriota bacterium]
MLALLLFLSLSLVRPAQAPRLPSASPDWRTEVSNFFSDGKPSDYAGAARYLHGVIDSLGDDDKPAAFGLLAYCYSRTGDKVSEYEKLGQYFEKYGALGMGFHFLPFSVQNDIARFLREWQLKYPWVLKIGFVASSGATPASLSANPPERIILGFEMASDVYYKLWEGEDILKGGLFRRGFNAVSLRARKLFREPGSFPYILEFKAGDFIVRRELMIGVEMDYAGILGSPARAKAPEYVVEMYFGDDLLASSRRTLPTTAGMGIEMPPPSGVYDPFGPGYQNKPKIPNSVPITAIPAAIAELIKALKKKDEIEPVPPVELRTDLTFPFRGKSEAGGDIEVRARVTLGLQSIKFMPYTREK